jgi:hypothetical protein
MSKVSVAEALGAFGQSYRSIDLRVAAIRDGDHWEVAFAAIRLSCESLAGVRAYHRELQRRHEPVETQDFWLALAVLDFRDWTRFRDELAAGMIGIGNAKVGLAAPLNLEAQTSYIRRSQDHTDQFRDLAWPSLDIAAGVNPVAKLNADHIVRAVGNAGYQTVSHAISGFCEVDTWPNSNYSHNLLLRLPIYGALSATTVQPLEDTLHLTLRRHKTLRSLAVRAMFTDNRSSVPKNRVTMKGKQQSAKGGIVTVDLVAPLPPGSLDGAVEFSLSHPLVGELERQRHQVRSFLPVAERNLLFEVFRHFCPPGTLEDMLTNPAGRKPWFKVDQSSSFEQHVGWLLSLLGFSAIALGKQENLFSGRVQLGSVDLIAVREREVFLVACTIGVPKREDFGSLWNLSQILQEKLAKETNAVVRPLLVTATTSLDTRERIGEGIESGSVPILGLERLRELVELLPARDPDELVDLLR